MATKLVFLDANMIMELLFRRSQYDLALASLLSLPEDTIVCTSILSTAIVFNFVESEHLDKEIAHNFMKGYKILDMSKNDYEWAIENDQGDFEDAMQASCAKRHNCSYILTLDKKFEVMYGKYVTVHKIS